MNACATFVLISPCTGEESEAPGERLGLALRGPGSR